MERANLIIHSSLLWVRKHLICRGDLQTMPHWLWVNDSYAVVTITCKTEWCEGVLEEDRHQLMCMTHTSLNFFLSLLLLVPSVPIRMPSPAEAYVKLTVTATQRCECDGHALVLRSHFRRNERHLQRCLSICFLDDIFISIRRDSQRIIVFGLAYS